MSRLALSSLVLLGFVVSGGSAQPPVAEGDLLFQDGRYREAAAWYAGVAAADPSVLSEKQKEAWAFSRIKLAAEPGSSARAEKDVAAAMAMVPNNTEIQKLGSSVLLLLKSRAVAAPPAPTPTPGTTIESASFTVKYTGNKDLAEKVSAAADAERGKIFERWSGPAGANWSPRCEIVLHATAESYAQATGQPAARTGHATVRLAEGKVLDRRIDLRADDAELLTNTLPRELTHVVLADLFPYTPPPKWAEEGMAVLAGNGDEVGRYLRTCSTCAREGKLFTVAALVEMKEYPAAEKITGFCCGSVSLVDYFVKLKGEKHFTTFLRDCQRYGSASALKRQYGIESYKALQDAWLKAAIK